MRHATSTKVIACAATIAGVSILSGCWHRERREPRHEDRVVVVHEERHEERPHEERRER